MWSYPSISPVALDIGFIQIHWYGLMYLFGFAAFYVLANRRVNRLIEGQDDFVSDLLFYGALGVILGGRIGYILFYDLAVYIEEPLRVFRVWEGGMSFHGGLLGVLTAMYLIGRKYQLSFWQITDFIAPMVPIGLGAGRVGNFINGELWGKVTDSPLGMWMMDPMTGQLIQKYPTQLFEALLEGLVMFVALWLYSAKQRPMMAVSGLFLILYGSFRFLVEFWRMPDAHIGYLAWDWLTMGQVLSFPMVVLGAALMLVAYKKHSVKVA